jgi:O-antigen/teichoic acid export membrane protein
MSAGRQGMRLRAKGEYASTASLRGQKLVRFLPGRLTKALLSPSHGSRRNRRIALSVVASGGARALQMATMLAIIPVAYGYLGVERFGFWMALTSVATFLAFADLGIGNGLINAIATADARGDRALARVQLSTAFWMLSAIALMLVAMFVPLFLAVDWSAWFKLSATPANHRDVNWSIIAAFLCFAIQMPLAVASKVRTGRQEIYVNSVFEAVGNCGMVLAVLAVVRWDGGLPTLVLCASGIPALGLLANLGHLIWRNPSLRPSWRDFSGHTARGLLKVGSMFLILNLSAAFAFASDTMLVIRIFGPETAGLFSIGLKLFGAFQTVIGICFMPLWPAYSEALGRMEIGWVRRAFTHSTLLSFMVAMPLALFLFAAANPLASLWLRSSFALPVSLLSAFAVWMVIQAAGTALGIFFNGAGLIRFEATIAVICAMVAFPAKILFAHAIGPSGVIWATVLSYVVFALVPSAIVIPRFFCRVNKQLSFEFGGKRNSKSVASL